MAIFEPVTLEWKGKSYTIAPDQVLKAIAIAEDLMPLGTLHRAMASGSLPIAKICMVFGGLLRYAGAEVKDEEVYDAMFEGQGAELQRRALDAVRVLHVLMIPPEHLRAAPSAKKKSVNGKSGSSVKSTSSRSARDG